MWDLSFSNRDPTCNPVVGAQSLNHWTIREVSVFCVFDSISCCCPPTQSFHRMFPITDKLFSIFNSLLALIGVQFSPEANRSLCSSQGEASLFICLVSCD